MIFLLDDVWDNFKPNGSYVCAETYACVYTYVRHAAMYDKVNTTLDGALLQTIAITQNVKPTASEPALQRPSFHVSH